MRALGALSLLALLLVGCGSDDDSLAVPVASNEPDGTVVEVAGFIFVEGGDVRLCEAIAESFPPQCGGSRIFVDGLDPAVLGPQLVTASGDLEPASDVAWTNDVVTMSGQMMGGRLQFEVLVEG
ncbi:MAG: hypothetical protein OEM22_03990 [Acidimicrobiia bacterium]|nr:hypothetical protein [Acidimicrobiia bacterium]MDH3470146.1 hypothetical protein [Acidimicrobiia bacterium]